MTARVQWLGLTQEQVKEQAKKELQKQLATEACGEPPISLDTETWAKFGEKCGKKAALKWIEQQSGVAVASCADEELKAIPECITNNYGATFDVIDENGNVDWEIVAQDAGAVGGIIVCAVFGASAALLPLCGKIGGEIGKVFYKVGEVVVAFGAAIIDLFSPDEGPLGTACNDPKTNDGGRWRGYQSQGRVVGSFLKANAKTLQPGNLITDLGPLVQGTQLADINPAPHIYWSRIMLLRGLALASAQVLSSYCEKTGLQPAEALKVLKLQAPFDWVELIRPEVEASPSNKNATELGYFAPNFIFNSGGFFSALTEPRVIEALVPKPFEMAPEVVLANIEHAIEHNKPIPQSLPKPIIPRWMLPQFWQGIPVAKNPVWRYFSFNFKATPVCEYSVGWGDVSNLDAAKKKVLSAKPGHYWLFSTPFLIDTIAWKLSDVQFQALLDVWKSSLAENMSAKIAEGKKLASSRATKSSSVLPTVLAIGAVAALAWWLLPSVLLENPMPRGATLRQEGGWWVLRFREGGFRKFQTKRDAQAYIGGLSR